MAREYPPVVQIGQGCPTRSSSRTTLRAATGTTKASGFRRAIVPLPTSVRNALIYKEVGYLPQRITLVLWKVQIVHVVPLIDDALRAFRRLTRIRKELLLIGLVFPELSSIR